MATLTERCSCSAAAVAAAAAYRHSLRPRPVWASVHGGHGGAEKVLRREGSSASASLATPPPPGQLRVLRGGFRQPVWRLAREAAAQFALPQPEYGDLPPTGLVVEGTCSGRGGPRKQEAIAISAVPTAQTHACHWARAVRRGWVRSCSDSTTAQTHA